MANILVASTPAPGHFNPMMAVARHLSSLGHSITFLSGSLFEDPIVASGFRFVSLTGKANLEYTRLDEEFPERAAAKPGPEALNAECIYTGITPVPDQYHGLQMILAEGPIDLIVSDVYFWGTFPLLLGPKDARPPVLTFGVLPLLLNSCDLGPFSGPDATPEGRLRNAEETRQFIALFQPSTEHFSNTLRACEAPELPEFFFDCASNLPDRFLQLTVEAFEYPRSDMKETIQFIGNLMPSGHTRSTMPAWWDSLDHSKPVVLVTQGTIANQDMSQLIEPAIAALANEQVTVIVATGRPDLEAVVLPGGIKPENTHIEYFIPFEKILPEVDVFLTNGGYGAVNLALSKGTPLVVAGDTEDKTFTSARVAWSETGISLGTGRPTGEQILTAVRSVLSDKKYKENAVKMQKEFEQYNAFDIITSAVDSLLSSSSYNERLEPLSTLR